MLRLFIAIDLPAEVKGLLHRLQTELRPHAPAMRWADVRGTHLTLFFLGQTPDEQLEPVQQAMRGAAAGARPFRLRTATPGAFPKPDQPRVVWLGVEGELAALAALQAAVTAALVPLGFTAEARPFAPHLTLGRARRDVDPAELKAVAGALRNMPAPQAVQFEVAGIVLMRSERLPAGARYTVLADAPLGG